MNTIFRFIFTIACLLTTLVANAYKIIGYRTLGTGSGTITATYNSSPVVTFEQGGDITDIPSNSNVTLTITPNEGYYLEKLEYEYVMDLGIAQTRRRTEISIRTMEEIAIHSDYAIAHYGGNYSFAMPASDIIIYATFQPCTSISDFTLTLDGDAASKVYDGYSHTLTLKNGGTTLVRGQDYTISPETYSWTDVFSSTPTLTGIGKYKSTKSDVTLSITQKPLTITAQAQTITYGSSIQTGISYVNVSDLVTNDALTSITLTPSTSQVTTTGTITPSGATTTKGISNYAVTYNTGALTIQAYDLSGIASVTFTQDYYNYDGSLHQPSIDNTDGSNMKVYYGNTRLTQGSDFTTSYTTTPGIYTNATDYTTPDIYTIDITFTGNYTGTKTATYQIRPKLQLKDDEPYRWEAYYNTEAYNMKVPTGVQAWVVNGFNTTAVELTEKEVIKTQTPMLLFRAGSTKTFYPELTAETPTWTGGSYLKYCDSSWYLTGDPKIQDGRTKICILVRDNFVRTVSGTLAAGKCYLDLSDTSYFGAPLRLDITPTSIDTPEKTLNDLNNGKWYTLDGRQIQGVPTQKGIYIVNGKKIIIK